MKLWQKEISTDKLIESFTIGRDQELDMALARFDVLGSMAHTRMLATIGLLTGEELTLLQKGLYNILKQIEEQEFLIEPGVEDIHSQVELTLTRQLGEVGKKIHSGRSRNDQVLVDLRMYYRHEIRQVDNLTQALFQLLQALAEKYKNVLMPGYTHYQVGMVSSFGLWLGAYAESFCDDIAHLAAVYEIVNQNPLGSAAGYGSSFPLDRALTTQLLGFRDLNYNSVHAQMGRGKTELFLAFALAAIGHTLGKLAMDIVLFINQNFGFISLPDHLTTGSSIMPHKKNPDMFELIRAHCNQLLSLPAQISQLTGNLPSGYHRDFQLLKEILLPAVVSLKDCLKVATYSLGHLEVNPDILSDNKYDYLFSVEEVNKLVLEGMPFRDAYRKVAADIKNGAFSPVRQVEHTHKGSIGNLCLTEIAGKMARAREKFDFDKVENCLKKLAETNF